MTEDIVKASDFKLATCQATIFTPDEEVSSVKLHKDFIPKFLDHFDGDPVTIPSGEGMPRDFPRLILQDKKGKWRCEFASARVNYFWRLTSEDKEQITLKNFFGKALELIQAYKEFAHARVGRIAAVVDSFSPHSSPGKFLAQHFCKNELIEAPLNRPESFELHAHKKYPLGGSFIVNSWVRNKTGIFGKGENKKDIILVQQDINTIEEETSDRKFTSDEIAGFYGSVEPEMLTILKLYYPE